MKISLTPADIIVAIKAHLVNTGVAIQDKTITFNFSNKRSKGGIFAEVTIYDDTQSPVMEAVVEALIQEAPTEVTEPVVEAPVQEELPLPMADEQPPVDVATPPPMINLFG